MVITFLLLSRPLYFCYYHPLSLFLFLQSPFCLYLDLILSIYLLLPPFLTPLSFPLYLSYVCCVLGGSFSLETSPFKLTEEMVDVLGGLESQLFGQFVKGFTSGFLALRTNIENIISNLKLLAINSPFPCFNGKDSNAILEKLRCRFRCDLSLQDTVQHCLDLIIASYGHYGTKQYDSFQWYTNGITP